VVGAFLHSLVEHVRGIDLAFVLRTPKWVMGMYLVDGPLGPILDQYLFRLFSFNASYKGCESIVSDCELRCW
jgi:hypothetical protein